MPIAVTYIAGVRDAEQSYRRHGSLALACNRPRQAAVRASLLGLLVIERRACAGPGWRATKDSTTTVIACQEARRT